MNNIEFEDQMNEYLKNNLRIDVVREGGLFGSQRYISIKLKLNDEIISESYIDEE